MPTARKEPYLSRKSLFDLKNNVLFSGLRPWGISNLFKKSNSKTKTSKENFLYLKGNYKSLNFQKVKSFKNLKSITQSIILNSLMVVPNFIRNLRKARKKWEKKLIQRYRLDLRKESFEKLYWSLTWKIQVNFSSSQHQREKQPDHFWHILHSDKIFLSINLSQKNKQ